MKYLKKYELFLDQMNKNDKQAFQIILDFYSDFKSKKDPNMVQIGMKYILTYDLGVIKWDVLQLTDEYKINYNYRDIIINKNTYIKINEIIKKIHNLKKEYEIKAQKNELEKIIGKNIKKYVEDKFQFYYDLEKTSKNYGEFLSSINSIFINYVSCSFGSNNIEFNYKKFYNDISSIVVYNKYIVFEFSYKKLPNYKEYKIYIDWGDSFIQKWKNKIRNKYETLKKI